MARSRGIDSIGLEHNEPVSNGVHCLSAESISVAAPIIDSPSKSQKYSFGATSITTGVPALDGTPSVEIVVVAYSYDNGLLIVPAPHIMLIYHSHSVSANGINSPPRRNINLIWEGGR